MKGIRTSVRISLLLTVLLALANLPTASYAEEPSAAGAEPAIVVTEENAPAVSPSGNWPNDNQDTISEEPPITVLDDESSSVDNDSKQDSVVPSEVEPNTTDVIPYTENGASFEGMPQVTSDTALLEENREPTEDLVLRTQAVTYKTLPTTGNWTYGYFSGSGMTHFYVFTLSKAGRVAFELQNWTTGGVWCGLYDDTLTTKYWGYDCSSNDPGTISHYSYLSAGTYRMRIRSSYWDSGTSGGGSGDYQIRATFSGTTALTRSNTTFNKAATLKRGEARASLFTESRLGPHYWKFSIPCTQTVTMVCKETAANVDSVSYLYLFDASQRQIDAWGVSTSATIDKTLNAGTYYIRIDATNNTGPYSLKWTGAVPKPSFDSAYAEGPSRIRINWSASNCDFVQVWRSDKANAAQKDYRCIGVYYASDGQCVSKMLCQNRNYWYKLRSYTKSNGHAYYSGYTEVKSAKTETFSAPWADAYTSGRNTVSISWTVPSSWDGPYPGMQQFVQVWRTDVPNGKYVCIGIYNASDGYCTSKKLKPNKKYWYKVRGYYKTNGHNYYSGYSGVVSATTWS